MTHAVMIPYLSVACCLLFKKKDTCLKKLIKLLDFTFLFFVLQELDSVLCVYVCICLICKCAGLWETQICFPSAAP